MDKEIVPPMKDDEESSIDFKELFLLFFSHWKWFVASVAIFLVVAVFWLMRQNDVYTVSSMILMKGENSSTPSSEAVVMEGFGLMSAGKINTDDEIGIMRSKNVLSQVVSDLKLYVAYYEQRGMRKVELYGDTPLFLDIDSLLVPYLATPIAIKAVPDKENGGYILTVAYDEEEQELPFAGDSMRVAIGDISFMLFKRCGVCEEPHTLYINVVPPKFVVRQLEQLVSASPVEKGSSLITMSVEMSQVEKAKDILYKIVYYYNALSMAEKNRVAENTERFIDERLRLLSSELGSVEDAVEDFMRNNELVDITANAASYLDESKSIEERLFDVETEMNRLDYVGQFITDTANRYSLIPAVEISNQTFLTIVDAYNSKLMERERLLRSVSESNPVLMTVSQDLEILRRGVKDGVVSTRAGMEIARRDLLAKKHEAKSRIQEVPGLQRESAEISRQQLIKDKLYVFLLEKREENSLNKTLTVPRAIIMDIPDTSGIPVSPKKKNILLIALFLGVCVPAGIIFLLDFFNDRFKDRADVEKLTTLPILGEICTKGDHDENLVVSAWSVAPITELFRLLRNNLQFVMTSPEKKVICVTSTVSGEGKTFLASNLALSFGLIGKKVLLVGMDIRRPQLYKYFDIPQVMQGVTTYLSGMENDITRLIIPSKVMTDLDLLPSGPIPPNPNELLYGHQLEELIGELRSRYDYIIIDTAPVGMVSDTMLIRRVTDVMLFVVRAGYTAKKSFALLDKIVSSGRFPAPYLVVNGVDMESRSYGYRRYGYHSSYGYDAGRVSAPEKSKPE